MVNYSLLLKEIRKKLGISQTELARRLDVDYTTISRIERNIFNPSYELITKIEGYSGKKNFSTDNSINLYLPYKNKGNLIKDLGEIISNSYFLACRSVNYLLIQRNWLIGRRISEEILTSRQKDYGKKIIYKLSRELSKKYGKGFDRRNLYYFVKFYNLYPNILHTSCSQSLLSWSHYRVLLQVENKNERTWYENETKNEQWSVSSLQRNISSQYFRRIISSNNNIMAINKNITSNINHKHDAVDFIKDPMILEFLGIGENNLSKESDLESAIISHIHKFLLELGKGYAFVARQQRIHTEKEDYYIDLVFYNYYLKCFVLIDLKTSKITHQDVGQMDMYIRMYDDIKKSSTDNQTIGIILTSDTDEDIARYSILNNNNKLFASKYKLYLPSEKELKKEIERQKNLFLLQNTKRKV